MSEIENILKNAPAAIYARKSAIFWKGIALVPGN
jgi:hypothetical protein